MWLSNKMLHQCHLLPLNTENQVQHNEWSERHWGATWELRSEKKINHMARVCNFFSVRRYVHVSYSIIRQCRMLETIKQRWKLGEIIESNVRRTISTFLNEWSVIHFLLILDIDRIDHFKRSFLIWSVIWSHYFVAIYWWRRAGRSTIVCQYYTASV